MNEMSAPQKMSPKDLMIVMVVALGSFMAGLDATFLFCILLEIIGIVLMLVVKKKSHRASVVLK